MTIEQKSLWPTGVADADIILAILYTVDPTFYTLTIIDNIAR